MEAFIHAFQVYSILEGTEDSNVQNTIQDIERTYEKVRGTSSKEAKKTLQMYKQWKEQFEK